MLDRCDEVATLTEESGRITRRFLSEPMRRLYGRVAGWMEAAGLCVEIDPAANLVGRYAGLCPEMPVLAIGSHLDSVPDAGKYDGVLGVLLGLAASVDELIAGFREARASETCRGFAVGRTIFHDASRAWFAGECDDATLKRMVRERYEMLIHHWREARSVPKREGVEV